MQRRNMIRFSQAPVSISLAAPEPEKQALAFTEEQLEEARREAYQRGFEDAARALEKQMFKQREEVLHLQQETFHSLAKAHESLLAQFQAVLPELALDIAKRALGGVEFSREIIASVVRETLGEIPPDSGAVEVSLHPRDLDFIARNDAEFRARHAEVSFRADADLKSGDCFVRSRFGVIDARLATKLKNIGGVLE